MNTADAAIEQRQINEYLHRVGHQGPMVNHPRARSRPEHTKGGQQIVGDDLNLGYVYLPEFAGKQCMTFTLNLVAAKKSTGDPYLQKVDADFASREIEYFFRRVDQKLFGKAGNKGHKKVQAIASYEVTAKSLRENEGTESEKTIHRMNKHVHGLAVIPEGNTKADVEAAFCRSVVRGGWIKPYIHCKVWDGNPDWLRYLDKIDRSTGSEVRSELILDRVRQR